ncbi:hypothetical protein BKA57DRAFT_537768 [Linnemannia elongata]|nr:hypothetical protein BKA57DRAFT_537768 [Linnemannia elongata]
MTHDLKYHAKQAIDSLYGLLFDRPAYDPSAQAGDCCIKPYHGENGAANPASFVGGASGGSGRAGRLASAVQDKVGSVASSASSAAASLVSTIGSGSGSHTAGHHHHHDGSSGSFWHSTPLESTLLHWKSVLHDYWHSLTEHSLSSPDLWHQLQSRLGVDHLARSWNLEPHIVLLLLLVPFMLLLLSSCLMLGAGNTTEEPRGPGRKSDPTKVGEKENQSRPTYASKVAGGSHPTSNAGKGKKVQGSKKGGTQDKADSTNSQNQLGNDNSISSWSALLGSAGFRGGEASSYKPIDIYAAMKSGGKTIAHTVEDAFAPGHDEGMVSNIIEEIVGSTETQHEQKEIGLDNENYIDNFPALGEHEHSVNHIDKSRASRSGPAGPSSSFASNSSAKIRVPRPYGAKEADRHRHQPHRSFREIERESTFHKHQAPQISFAAKVMDFTQENPAMNSLDGISGGVLGAVMTTFAAIVSIAEDAATSMKENMPFSVDELAHDLRSSFDKAVEQGGLEGSGLDEQDDDSYIPSNTTRNQSHKTESRTSGPSSSSSSSPRFKDNFRDLFSLGPAMSPNYPGSTSPSSHPDSDKFEEFSKGPAMLANPPRLRKRSVVQAHPGTAADIAAAILASPTASPPSHKAAVIPAHSKKSVASNPSDKSAPHAHAHTHAHVPAPASSKTTAPSSYSAKATSTSKPAPAAPAKATISVEDSSSHPAAHPVSQTNNSSPPAQKTSAQKNNVKVATTEAISGAKDASGHVAEGTKKAISKAAGDVKSGAKVLAKDARKASKEAKVTVEAGAEKTHVLKGAAVDKAHEFKSTSVKKANEATKVAKDAIDKNVVQSIKNAEKVDGAVKDAEKAVEETIKNAADATQKAKGAAVKKANEAADMANELKDTVIMKANEAAKDAKGTVDTATEKANELKEAVVEKAGEAVEQAKDIIDRNVIQPIKNAEKNVETTLKDNVKGTEKNVYKAKDAAVQMSGEVSQSATDAAKGAEKKVEDAVNKASTTAHRAKDAAVERAGEVAHAAAEAVKDAEKQLEDAVKHAAEVAKEAKDAALGKASEVVQAAGDAVKDAERRLEEAVRYAAEVAKEAKDAAVVKAGEMAHAAAAAVMDAERRLEDVVRDADDSFDEGSLIDADESIDEAPLTTAAVAQLPMAATPVHSRSASPSEAAQIAMEGAVDEIADVAESLSSMFAGFKDSVARAFKDVKDLASHVGPVLAPASISVSPAYATGHLESSPTSSSSSSVFKHVDSQHKSAVHALAASTAAVAPASDTSHKDANKQHHEGMIDGRSYSEVVKVTPVTTPKLHAANLPGSFPTTPATDDSSVHPHDEAPDSSSSDDQADASPTKAQEYTVDESGNKVPVVDARRDSGFDLLM